MPRGDNTLTTHCMDLFLDYVAAQTTKAINNPKAKTKEVVNIRTN